MTEFRFLVAIIVVLELALFACGYCVVQNRHYARQLFIELEHQQQVHHSLVDEQTRLLIEISNLEQSRQIEQKAREKGLSPAQNENVIILDAPFSSQSVPSASAVKLVPKVANSLPKTVGAPVPKTVGASVPKTVGAPVPKTTGAQKDAAASKTGNAESMNASAPKAAKATAAEAKVSAPTPKVKSQSASAATSGKSAAEATSAAASVKPGATSGTPAAKSPKGPDAEQRKGGRP